MMDKTDAIYAISVDEYSGEGSSLSCYNLVKTTIYSKKKWTLSHKNETLIGDNIVYVFVTLNKPGTPEYHIVPSKVIALQISEPHRLWLQHPGNNGQKHNDSPVRKFSDADDIWLDRWDVLTGVNQ